MTTPLEQFQFQLRQVRLGHLLAREFCTQARGNRPLLDALPPRYEEVLGNLLDRLESAALFTEESCSFSQTDLLDSLVVWANKAAQQLQQT